MIHLREELQSSIAEKNHLLSEKSKDSLPSVSELEQIQLQIASISEERDQLLEVLNGLREEKIQLQTELEEKNDLVCLFHLLSILIVHEPVCSFPLYLFNQIEIWTV